MTYKIIGDSCLDLPKEMKADPHYQLIPLTLQIDDVQIVDDETFDQANFIRLAAKSENCPKSACPSPESFKAAYECEEENIFVITLSEHLSGTYNSAKLAKDLYIEEHGHKNIAVFSSDSASAGELLIALRIQELCEAETAFDEVVRLTTEFRDHMNTYFVLESLDALKKNGRLTGLQAFFATALNIKPVMGAEKGVIIKRDQARGINKALTTMAKLVEKEAVEPQNKILAIAHCNNLERAKLVQNELEKKLKFKKVFIVDTAGVATLYASDGGIIVAL